MRLAFTAAVILLLVLPASRASAQSWVITGATLIDGTGAGAVEGAVIVGRGERITCVGRTPDCQMPAGARVTDATGKWVIPGLIDTHVHLNWSNDRGAAEAQRTRLAFGITTVREAGTPGTLEGNLARRQSAESAVSTEPRLVVSALVSQEHLDRYGERDVAALVRRLAGLGANAIKIKQKFTPEELQAIVSEAHASALPVFGHTWGPHPYGSRLAPALDAGIDGLSHMDTFAEFGQRADAQRPPAPEGLAFWVWTKERWNYQDDARLSSAIERSVRQRVWVEPLLTTERHFTLPYPLPEDVDYLGEIMSMEQLVRRSLPVGDTGWVKSRQRQQRLAIVYDRMCAFVRQYHARGGIVIAGTDEVAPGPDLVDEISLLTGCGLTPIAALLSATGHAALALKRQDVGIIAAGKLADLVLLDADPLSDPSHLRRTWRVVKGGHVHDPAALLAETKSSHVARLRAAWAARTATAGTVIAVLGGLLTGYRRFRGRRDGHSAQRPSS